MGTAIPMTHPNPLNPPLVRVLTSAPNVVNIGSVNPLTAPTLMASGVAAVASALTAITTIGGKPVVLEGAVVTCVDGYVGTIPVTGATPNFM
jgi:hypothetical protein